MDNHLNANETTASILIEALPYIKQFSGTVMVIKLGGSIMDDDILLKKLLQDVVLMKYVGIRPVIVHGGGKHISSLMKRVGKEAVFKDGLRITDEDTMQLTQMVLSGLINKDIVSYLAGEGAAAVGISGKDGGLIQAAKLTNKKNVDYGQVGEIVGVNPSLILSLENSGFIPVISPIAFDEKGQSLNINADTAAMAIAESLKCEKLIFITDVPGVMKDLNDPNSLIKKIELSKINSIVRQKYVSAGMIPKLLSSRDAIKKGVTSIHIISGRQPHSLLLEIFTQNGIGTKIS